MKPDDSEAARLKRELIRVKAERDIQKKPLGSSSRTRGEVCGNCEVSAHRAIGLVVQDAWSDAGRILRLVEAAGERTRSARHEVEGGDRAGFERSNIRRASLKARSA